MWIYAHNMDICTPWICAQRGYMYNVDICNIDIMGGGIHMELGYTYGMWIHRKVDIYGKVDMENRKQRKTKEAN